MNDAARSSLRSMRWVMQRWIRANEGQIGRSAVHDSLDDALRLFEEMPIKTVVTIRREESRADEEEMMDQRRAFLCFRDGNEGVGGLLGAPSSWPLAHFIGPGGHWIFHFEICTDG